MAAPGAFRPDGVLGFEGFENGTVERYGVLVKSLSLNNPLRLNPPLEKGDIGGFALDHFGKIPPTPPFAKGGILFTDEFIENGGRKGEG
jgi:hypothetical protein